MDHNRHKFKLSPAQYKTLSNATIVQMKIKCEKLS